METKITLYSDAKNKMIKDITEFFIFYKQNLYFHTNEEIKEEILKITESRIEDLIKCDKIFEVFSDEKNVEKKM